MKGELLDVELERASAQIDDFIERRAQGRDGRDAANERARLLEESVERYAARRRDRNRWEWVRYFDRMARNHAGLAEEYERRAQALQEGDTAA